MSVSRTTCPSCGAGLKSAAGFNPGQAVRCPKCATPFTVPDFEVEEDDEPAPKKKGPPARAARARDDDDRPRRRPRDDDDDDDDDDDRPRKKKKKSGYQEYKSSPVRFAVLGVLLVIMGVLAFLLYQKKMREKEDAQTPAPESGNQQLAPPIRPGPRPGPGPVGDGAVVAGGPKADDFRPAGDGPNAAATERGMNGMKQVMLAMHNYHDRKNSLPAAAVTGPDGKALLSWRVALLPFLGQDALHKQFKLTEPWDSPANRPLLAQMPAVYQGTLVGNDGKTAFKVFVGGGALFDVRQGRRLSAVPDGTSNTLAVVESGAPVEWTKPEDIPFDGRTAPRLLSPTGGDTILAATADGAVRRLSLTRNGPDTIRRLVGAGDGEVVDIE